MSTNAQPIDIHPSQPPHLYCAPPAGDTARSGLRGGLGGLSAESSARTVMVVDDSAVDRTNLISILEREGLKVIAASSGAEALELAKRAQPNIIFLDIMLGEMDGFKTCRSLHRDPDTAAIPVVMVSSKKNKSDMVWAAEQGARGYIVKPYSAEDILSAIEQFA